MAAFDDILENNISEIRRFTNLMRKAKKVIEADTKGMSDVEYENYVKLYEHWLMLDKLDKWGDWVGRLLESENHSFSEKINIFNVTKKLSELSDIGYEPRANLTAINEQLNLHFAGRKI
jgi:hypothetical protein